MQSVVILGATGSIGTQSLSIIQAHPDRFRVLALTGHRQMARLLQQCQVFNPKYVVVADQYDASRFEDMLCTAGVQTEVLWGVSGLCDVAAHPEADVVISAIVGAAGLQPTMAAVAAGQRILLANKESLVMAGGLIMPSLKQTGAVLIPVDSEHNAIFQCAASRLPNGEANAEIQSVTLTASGGALRNWPIDRLAAAQPQDAVRHPNWQMGAKISVDSATMMNKGLEVIEAHWLFGLSADHIQVVIHPESYFHGFVQFCDGTTLAHVSPPDMRVAISHALAWPDRVGSGVVPLSIDQLSKATFSSPDLRRYPCLGLAFQALQAGSAASIVLNAANEVAVSAFLAGQMGFNHIADTVDHALQHFAATSINASSIEEILALDQQVRAVLLQFVGQFALSS